jgi:hypothetical protein
VNGVDAWQRVRQESDEEAQRNSRNGDTEKTSTEAKNQCFEERMADENVRAGSEGESYRGFAAAADGAD